MNHMIDGYGNLAPGEYEDDYYDEDEAAAYADDYNDDRLLDSVM